MQKILQVLFLQQYSPGLTDYFSVREVFPEKLLRLSDTPAPKPSTVFLYYCAD
ncbi:MAG: hypothetical protein IJP54_05675 [Synergistaceae bacterium]|nr:hypothetical protein [Synergistaceae bacterium]